jgi:hypothetical protein
MTRQLIEKTYGGTSFTRSESICWIILCDALWIYKAATCQRPEDDKGKHLRLKAHVTNYYRSKSGHGWDHEHLPLSEKERCPVYPDILKIINLTCCLPYGLSARPLRWPSAAQFFKDLHRMAGLSLFPSENLWTTKLQPLDWPVHLPTNSVNMVQDGSSIEHATSCNNLFDQHGKVRIHETTLCYLKPSEWSETRWQNPKQSIKTTTF